MTEPEPDIGLPRFQAPTSTYWEEPHGAKRWLRVREGIDSDPVLHDPGSYLDYTEDRIVSWEDLDESDLRGELTRHLRIRVHAVPVWESDFDRTHAVHVWVDASHRIRGIQHGRIGEWSLGDSGVALGTIEYWDYGSAPSVDLPPEEDVIERPLEDFPDRCTETGAREPDWFPPIGQLPPFPGS